MLGVVAYFENNHRQAVEHLRRYVARFPRHRTAQRYLASAYLALGEHDEVIALIESLAPSIVEDEDG